MMLLLLLGSIPGNYSNKEILSLAGDTRENELPELPTSISVESKQFPLSTIRLFQ